MSINYLCLYTERILSKEIYIYTGCINSTYIGLTEDFDNEYLDLRKRKLIRCWEAS
jgi:hypothetical protein